MATAAAAEAAKKEVPKVDPTPAGTEKKPENEPAKESEEEEEKPIRVYFPAEKPKEKKDLSDDEFTMVLMNEDICCPVCYRPFLPAEHQLQEGEGYVEPVRLDCTHAMCRDCCKKFYEEEVAFLGHGVRCKYHKIDQIGNGPFICNFVTPKKPEELPIALENQIIAQVLRDTGVILGTSKPKEIPEEAKGEFYYWYKVCRNCRKRTKVVCMKCKEAFCTACWEKHKAAMKHEDGDMKTLEDYDKDVIHSRKCVKCDKQASKYCGICKHYLCSDRKNCYDPCMDPDHLLLDFEPNIIEMKRAEATAMDNSRKMFIHDVHDYTDTDPFMWHAMDLACLHRTMWHQAWMIREEEKKKEEEKKEAKGEEPKKEEEKPKDEEYGSDVD